MAGNIFVAERSIVVATASAGVQSFEGFDGICDVFCAEPFIGGILLNAEVANAVGGLDRAMTSVTYHSRFSGAIGIYDRVIGLEADGEVPDAFAERMAAHEVSGVLLHPGDRVGDSLILKLANYGIGAIVDVGVPADATEFDPDQVWNDEIERTLNLGANTFWVPGGAAESVGVLRERLLLETGDEDRFTFMAACPDTFGLENMLIETSGNLHVVVRGNPDFRLPDGSVRQTLRYRNAEVLLGMMISSNDPMM